MVLGNRSSYRICDCSSIVTKLAKYNASTTVPAATCHNMTSLEFTFDDILCTSHSSSDIKIINVNSHAASKQVLYVELLQNSSIDGTSDKWRFSRISIRVKHLSTTSFSFTFLSAQKGKGKHLSTMVRKIIFGRLLEG